jgi:hypothetical protein
VIARPPVAGNREESRCTKLDVRLEDETVWLNQRQITELFGKAKGTISEHIKHIFEGDAPVLRVYAEQDALRGKRPHRRGDRPAPRRQTWT